MNAGKHCYTEKPLTWSIAEARALAETNPQALITSLIALTRTGEKSLGPQVIEALNRVDAVKDAALHLRPLLRAVLHAPVNVALLRQ